MRDNTLRQNVIDELEFEPSLNAAHIGIAVENGVVTLSGHVGTYAEKLAAEKAVKRVKGVRGIAEEIEVRLPEDKKTADDQIAMRALRILEWNSATPGEAVQVKVQNGWVTLSGQVDWQYQRAAAEKAVRKLSGVVGVMNNIAIKKSVQADDVKHSIEQALKRSAQVKANGIRVSVLGDGTIGLEGSVHGWGEHDAVERAAWSVPGVHRIEDKLMVG